ncbi:hypothetical protein VMCG_01204 [Cytospora schulzeri]|uniref:Uncharacterized protein n=1 Tax=Cytospora schulzeri TaxID=448051 RepID=A0A423X6B1_9PEZI|nr:hypothetical protein VMCG_01204 [Valsa malicola]
MPSLTQPPTKKRRHDDHDANGEYHLFPQDFHHDLYQQHHGTHPRKIIQISSPLAKKMRMNTEWSGIEEQRQSPLAPTLRHNHSRSPSATKVTPKPPTTTSHNLLSPCHICHRKPTKKNELDSYADCEGCGERTCYVCIRECLGWKATEHSERFDREVLMRDQDNREDEQQDEERNSEHLYQSFSMEDAPIGENQQHDSEADQDPTKRGGTWGNGNRGHRGRICSQCCVENGPEGEVICLGCLES